MFVSGFKLLSDFNLSSPEWISSLLRAREWFYLIGLSTLQGHAIFVALEVSWSGPRDFVNFLRFVLGPTDPKSVPSSKFLKNLENPGSDTEVSKY